MPQPVPGQRPIVRRSERVHAPMAAFHPPTPPPGSSDSERIVCPRCESLRTKQMPRVAKESVFDWRECEDCNYLWAIPRLGSTPSFAGV
jgi:hypothetical protein